MDPFVFEDGSAFRGKKHLGQFFTPDLVTFFATGLSLEFLRKPRGGISILDPACGDGCMLWASHRYVERVMGETPRLTGVEIDPDVFPKKSSVPPDISFDEVKLVCGDLFTLVFDAGLVSDVSEKHDFVIGNPPYVRHLLFADLLDYVPDEVRKIFESRYPRHNSGKTFIRILKCSLIASYLGIDDPIKADDILEDESMLPKGTKDVAWVSLVRDIHSFSDLSIYTWMRAFTLLKKGGVLCFVVSNTWRSRDYGVVLKKFFRDFLHPVVVVSQIGKGWFKDAQVDTQIMVCVSQNRMKESRTVRVVNMSSNATFLDLDSSDVGYIGSIRKISKMIASSDESKDLGFGRLDIVDLDDFLSLGEGDRKAVSHEVAALVRRHGGSLDFTCLDSLGARVHQGLRTGCNSFFYLSRIKETKDEAVVVAGKEMGKEEYLVPKRFLKPVVKKQSFLGPPIEGGPSVGTYALVIPKGTMRKVDAKGKNMVVEVIEGDLLKLINKAENTTVVTNGKRMRIPDLSAVRTNHTQENAEKGVLAGFWYNIPIQSRHCGDIFVPRINGKSFSVGLNNGKEKFLVDANFSTITVQEDSGISIMALYAYLNSSFFRYVLESSGNPMGGGALKVEGALLKRVPMPVFSHELLEELRCLGSRLVRVAESGSIVPDIDDICARALVGSGRRAVAFQKDLVESRMEKMSYRMMPSSRRWITASLDPMP